MAIEIFPQSFVFSRLFGVVSVISGRFLTSLTSVFNFVHTFVCGDNVGSSTTNPNELIPGAGCIKLIINFYSLFCS